MQQPIIANKPELTVVGLQRSFIHALSPGATNMEIIGALWGEFLQRAGSAADRAGHAMYGVIFERPRVERSHPDELEYIAGVAVNSTADVPTGMVARTIPAAPFAVFVHRGPIKTIGTTVREIYRDWLPASPYEHSHLADIELYDERFCPDAGDSVMEYWISVRPRPIR